MFTKRQQKWLELFFSGVQLECGAALSSSPTSLRPLLICVGQDCVCGLPGTGMTGENVLSPPLLLATKYVHAARCLVNGHPGLPSPGQTWGSPANFRNDSSAQLLPSHWRGGRVWGGRGGAVREGDVCEGVPDTSPSPLLSRLGGVSALPPGEISRAAVVPVTRGLVWRRYCGTRFYEGPLAS